MFLLQLLLFAVFLLLHLLLHFSFFPVLQLLVIHSCRWEASCLLLVLLPWHAFAPIGSLGF